MEIEGFVDEEEGQPRNRLRSWNQRGQASNKLLSPPSHQKLPLKQGSLGLKLIRTPSFLKMIQMKLCQDHASCVGTLEAKDLKLDNKKDKKFKASHFAAFRLRIGSWEHKANSAGLGLKVKIYFTAQKLTWELLDGDLKYKMEIQWSDITALKANCPRNQPGTLRIVLGKQPLFFKETNPQPKKPTIWRESGDFTGGQASTHMQHFLEIPQGVLDKHYQNLIQCDTRLRLLSQLPETILDSPKFVAEASNSVEWRDNVVNQFQIARKSLIEQERFLSTVQEGLPKDNSSPTSVIGSCATKVNANSFQNLKDLQQLGVPILRPSLSIDYHVGHVEPFISEGTTLEEDPPSFETATDSDYEFREFYQTLFSDTTTTTGHENKVQGDHVMAQEEKGLNDVTGYKQLQGISDSNVEFLHGLPGAFLPHS